MGNTYVLLGGGCATAIQTALFLLEQADTDKVVAVGRSPLRSEPFSLKVNQHPKYKYHAYHITHEFDLLMDLLDKIQPNIIINFAAQGETSVSWQKSWRFFETNCVAMARLSEELNKRAWLQKFLHVSTAGVYGFADFPVPETHALDPASPYAASKAAFDMYIKSMQKINKLPIILLRPATLYAPGQTLNKVIPKAIITGLKGEKLPLHGGGKIDKSYLHARDFARAIYLIAQLANPGKIYNVGPEKPQPLYEVIELIASELGLSFTQLCNVTEDRLLQDGGYWLDTSAVRKDTGWQPQISMQQGVREVVAWVKQYLQQLKGEATNYQLRG